MLKDAKEFSGVNMKQGPGSLCQPCCCRTVTSLHLKWNKVSTVTISSQLPTEVTLAQKTSEELFLLCVCWGFFTPGELLQAEPNSIPQLHQYGETRQPVPPVQLCQNISLCIQVLGRELRPRLAGRELCTRLYQQYHETEMCSQT